MRSRRRSRPEPPARANRPLRSDRDELFAVVTGKGGARRPPRFSPDPTSLAPVGWTLGAVLLSALPLVGSPRRRR